MNTTTTAPVYAFLGVWDLVLFLILVALVYFTVRALLKAREYMILQEKLVETVEKRTQRRYNAIATMGPKNLTDYLIRYYSILMELEATIVGRVDPNGAIRLETQTMARLMEFIGEDTNESISYYYGEDYVLHWARIAFRILDDSGVIAQALNSPMNSSVRAERTLREVMGDATTGEKK